MLSAMLLEQNISMSTANQQLFERAQWNMNSYMDVLNKRVFGTNALENVEHSRSAQIAELLVFLQNNLEKTD